MRIATVILVVTLATHAVAQTHQPYAGLEQRTVKSLSEQQISDLRAGRGMGLALAAELNGYPGPAHVLENATALALTVAQLEQTNVLFDAMKAEAIPLGEKLIEEETALDRLFADRKITPESLNSAMDEIASTEGRLRETHLKYHLAMMSVLTAEQVERYRTLRGYGGSDMPQHHMHQP